MRRALVLGIVALSCNGTTGDNLLTFSAYASGVQGASQPFTAGDFTIQLTAARMHIGAVYFDEAPPGTGFDGPVCIASGIYAAQVPGPVDVDLLSTAPQEFTVYGNGSTDTAQSWQVWLTDGDVNEVTSRPSSGSRGPPPTRAARSSRSGRSSRSTPSTARRAAPIPLSRGTTPSARCASSRSRRTSPSSRGATST